MKKLILLVAMGIALTTQTLFAQVPSYVPTNGLVGYWPFNGNANDESGNGNNGTVNGATLTPDRFGNAMTAYNFNGTSSNQDYIIANNPISNQESFTISYWISRTDVLNNKWHLMINNNNNYTGTYEMISVKDTIYFRNFGNGVVNFDMKQKVDIPNNTAFNVCVTSDTNSTKLFINGVQYQQNSTQKLKPIAGQLFIGKHANFNVQSNSSFNGTLDDIGIWNRALTQEEITNLYNANQCITNITVTDTLIINVGQLSFNDPVTWANNITIAPNPASTQINISFNNITNLNGGTLKIINSLGQEVATTPITTSGTNSTMQLATWGGTGMYFVQIINPQGQIVDIKKIILQ